MRPLKMIISAFGPYAGTTTIDFEKLGENGIYLITGTTGAGKTTIFDAITYALFGEPSGDNRSVTMLRSQYALPQTPTEVELVFKNADKIYTIKRSPEYERPAKKGTGTVTQKSEALLTYPDGKTVSKTTEVNNAIREILGIDRKQFSQIAMIAQGDFLKLLHADTKERQKIFRDIFGTGAYQIIQEKLKDEASLLSKKYDEAKIKTWQYIDGILCDENDDCYIDTQKAKAQQFPANDVPKLLEELIEKDNALSKQIQNDICEIEQETQELSARIVKSESFDKKQKEKEKIQKEILEMNSLHSFLLERVSSRRKSSKDDLQKEKQIAQIQTQFEEYDLLSKKQSSASELSSRCDKIRFRKVRTLESLEELHKESDKIKKFIVSANEKALKKEVLLRKKEDTSNKIARTKEVLTRLSAFEKMNLNLKNAQENYQKAAEESASKNENYLKLNKLFLDCQAGILAQGLKENTPCPVCGSLTHPNKALKQEHAPTEKEIEKAKKEADKASSNASTLSVAAAEILGKVKLEEESLSTLLKEILDCDNFEEAAKEGNKTLSIFENELASLNKEIFEIDESIKEKEKLEKELPKKEETLKELNESIANDEKSLAADEATLTETNAQIEEISKKLKFKSKNEAVSFVDKQKNEIEKNKAELEKAEKEQRDTEKELTSLSGKIEQLSSDLSEREDIETQKLKDQKQVLLHKKEELTKKHEAVLIRISTNSTAKENIETTLSTLNEIEEKWTWVKALSDTANGKSGKEKIMLETYIQTTFFESIIEKANTRLMIMSGGQYQLLRRQEATNHKSQTGLDLDVKDNYNGSVRDVKSLSGGESFKASLSLALGLSDEIQSQAGGIRLDTMFVDEGFGSLDDESLQQALKALSDLSQNNKLIGIISHVADLKERIDKQIVVTKDKSGGSKVSVIV